MVLVCNTMIAEERNNFFECLRSVQFAESFGKFVKQSALKTVMVHSSHPDRCSTTMGCENQLVKHCDEACVVQIEHVHSVKGSHM